MAKLLRTFDRELEHARENELYENVEGFMIVEDWQQDLKKINVRVTWDDPDTADPREFSEVFFFHKNSDYGQGE